MTVAVMPVPTEQDWTVLLTRHVGPPPCSRRALRDRLAVFLRATPDVGLVRVRGSSLLLHALTGAGKWAVPDLLKHGARPLPGEPFLLAIMTHLPACWGRAFPARWGMDERDFQGNTPLHQAVKRPKPTAVEALLLAGADPNAINREGATPLHAAVDLGLDPGARIRSALIARGAAANQPDAIGWSPFQKWLARSPLLEPPPAGVVPASSVSALDPEGVSPLSRVLRAHTAELCPLPLGKTVIWAPARDPSPWLHVLTAMGADWGARNGDGSTARADFHEYRSRLVASPHLPQTPMREALERWARALALDDALPSASTRPVHRPRV